MRRQLIEGAVVWIVAIAGFCAGLSTGTMKGLHSRDPEVAKLKAEIAELNEQVPHFSALPISNGGSGKNDSIAVIQKGKTVSALIMYGRPIKHLTSVYAECRDESSGWIIATDSVIFRDHLVVEFRPTASFDGTCRVGIDEQKEQQ